MTCKDCVHYEVCRHFVDLINPLLADHNRIDINENTDICKEHFQDRSRFVELPIKPGEKVFYFDTAGRIYESTVTQMVYGATGFLIDSDVMFNSNLIGERFFLTREAAEQALKEREG